MILIRLFGLLLAFLLCREAAAQASKPNIILIVTDDQGWSDVGFNGAKDIQTPHLDRIAGEGIVFSQAYVSHPYCSPSRAGLLTGRYQARFGHDCNPPYQEDDASVGTPLSETMLSEVLKNNGYRTCAIGKWHLGDHASLLPPQRGFDHWFGFSSGGMNYWGSPQGKHKTIYRNDEPVFQAELSYLTDDFTEEAVKYIADHKDAPFFMYLAYNAPHAPDQVTEKYLEKTKHIEYGGRSVYAAMVAAVDAGIGRIDSTLQALEIKENTIIVFLSDNGGRAEHANNMPYRGHKGMLFEGGIRVPFFMSWPRGIQKPAVYDQAIISLDLFPTLLAASKTKPHKELALDGVNLLPFLNNSGKELPHDILFWRSVGGFEYAVRQGEYKLYMSRYKDRTLLYNLDVDPFEHEDIASQHPQLVEELKNKYEAWNSEMIHPQWLDPHPENVKKEAQRWRQIRAKALPPSSGK